VLQSNAQNTSGEEKNYESAADMLVIYSMPSVGSLLDIPSQVSPITQSGIVFYQVCLND